MSYLPEVNDYVRWVNDIEGWVYFKCKGYITIEQSVRLKTPENYEACPLHRNERLLVLCFQHQWNQLEKIGYRIHKDNLELLEEWGK